MAEKIQKQFKIEHVVNGLETALKKYKELQKAGVDVTKQIKQLESQLAAAKINPEVSSASLDIWEEDLRKVLVGLKQTLIQATKGLGKVSKKQAQEVAKDLSEIDKKLISIEKKESDLDSNFKSEDGSFDPGGRSSKVYQNEIQPVLDKKMSKDAASPFTGAAMTNSKNYLKVMDELDNKLDGTTKGHKELADSIRKKAALNEKLNKKELNYLNNVIKNNDEIKVSGEDLIKQLKNRDKLKKKEQDTLKKLYTQKKKDLEDEKEALKLKKEGLKIAEKERLEQAGKGKNLSKKDLEQNKKNAESFSEVNKELGKLNQKHKERKQAERSSVKETKKNTDATKKQSTTFGKAAQQVFNYGLAFTALRRIYTETLSTITDLDSAFTEMAIVTSMSREEAWQLVGTMEDLAKETGFTTTEIAKLTTVYLRQGRTLREVQELTRVAAQAARVAGISAGESADFLTSAVNAFRLSADEALAVSDRFAALAASSASSYQELATGLSKFAAQANVAGIGIDFAMGMLAKGVETTREAPETIGTAIKSVTARMRELSDLGKTFEDGMDINRVETALRQVGVALRDETGQFRNLEEVLTDVGMKFQTLNKNQQASVAVALAGIRQQSRLISIMNDFERTQELVTISTESAGATTAQHAEFMKGMEAATTLLRTSYQQFIRTITDSDLIIGIIRGLANVIEFAAEGLDKLGASGTNAMIGIGLFAAALKSYTIIQRLANSEGSIGTIVQAILGTSMKKNTATTQVNTAVTLKNTIANMKNTATKKAKTLVEIFASKATMKSTLATKLQTKALAKGAIMSKVYTLASIGAKVAALGFSAAISLTPIGWFAAGIAAIAAVFTLYKKGSEDAAKGTDSFASTVYDFFNSFIQIFKEMFDAFSSILKIFVRTQGRINSLLFRFLRLDKILIALKATLDIITIGLNGFAVLFAGIEWLINKAIDQFDKLKNKLSEVKDSILSFLNITEGTFLGNLFGVGDDSEGSRILDFIEEAKNVTEGWVESLDNASKSYEELTDSLKDTRRESEAENFQLSKKNRTMQDIIKEHNELQELRENGIFGEEELQREAELLAELENFEGGEFLVIENGQVSFEKTIDALEVEVEKNKEEIANNLSQLAEDAVILAEKDFERFLQNRDGALSDVQNFLLNQATFDPKKGTLERQRESLRNFFRNVIEEEGEVDLNLLQSEDLQGQADQFVSTVNEFDEALIEGEKTFSEVADLYNQFKNTLEEEELPVGAFIELNKDLEVVLNSLSDLNESDFNRASSVLDFIGFQPRDLNELNDILSETSMTTEEFLLRVGGLSETLTQNGVEPANAVSRAISEVASTFEDTTVAASLFGLALKDTMLETAQAADLLASRFTNLQEKQAAFISGDLKAEDLYNLIESYSSLFANTEFVNAFKSGGNLSGFLTDQILEQYELYEDNLISVENQLERYKNGLLDLNRAEYEGLVAQRNRLLLLMEYQGELSNLTTSQYAVNQSMLAFERIEKLGITNTQTRLKLIQSLKDNIGPVLFEANKEISDLTNQIETLTGLETTDGIFKIVDGVVVLQEGFDDLNSALQQQVNSLLGLIDSELEGIISSYEQYMEQTIKYEEDLAKEKIKVYEEYFDKLDKLESQRELETDRNSLVQEIARLQGATDEASRKKALDLRQELNKLNEKSEDQILKDARASLIDSVNQSVENIKTEFQGIITDWINSGALTGQGLYDLLESKGLVGENGFNPVPFVVEPSEAFNDVVQFTGDDTEETPTSTVPDFSGVEETTSSLEVATQASTAATESLTGEISSLNGNVSSLNGLITGDGEVDNSSPPVDGSNNNAGGQGRREFAAYAKGGIADYTGLAMLHGTKTDPEAVLNPEQTEIFKRIPEMIASLQGAGSAISIDNISISTESLNTNQDFANAGETLAKAFSKAIQRKGVTVNTKR